MQTSGETDGVRGCELPPWQAKYKNRVLLNLYFAFSIILVFSKFLFLFIFVEYFPVI